MKNRFHLVFISATALTALCGILMGAMALFAPSAHSPQIAAAFDALKYGFTLGMLSILGLLRTISGKPTDT